MAGLSSFLEQPDYRVLVPFVGSSLDVALAAVLPVARSATSFASRILEAAQCSCGCLRQPPGTRKVPWFRGRIPSKGSRRSKPFGPRGSPTEACWLMLTRGGKNPNLSGVLGLLTGAATIPIVGFAVAPAWKGLKRFLPGRQK